MSGNAPGGEKTEKATPKRVKKARRDGQIGNTPELGTWLGMLAASFVLPHVVKSIFTFGSQALVQAGAVIRSPDIGMAVKGAQQTAGAAIKAIIPLAVMIGLISLASVAAQGGLWFSPKLLAPKFKRLNPLSGLKRMFGPHGWWTLCKSMLKSLALGLVVYLSIRKLIPTIMGSGSLQLDTIVHLCSSAALNMLRFASAAGLAMAVADFAVTKRRNNKSLKMSKQEIKDEFKNAEGDPHIRGQRRSRALAMARNRMMADVPSADVVLVNPTHVAVALKYDPARGAPRVVAKGADHVAARIRAIADEARVPMVSDIPLARTLYKSCEVGQEIPPDLYRAVATVLAFVITLKRRGSAAGTHTMRNAVPIPA